MGWWRWMIAILAGVVAFILVMLVVAPWSIIDTIPQVCYSKFGYEVACNFWIGPVAGLAAAGLVIGLFWTLGRERARTTHEVTIS